VPGEYHEFFGVVQEGVAWFSDNGQGGPPDNQIEALIDLVPGDPTTGDMGGGGAGGAGGTGGGDDGGTGGGGAGGGDGSGNGSGNGNNPEGGGGTVGAAPHGGCSVAGSSTGDGLVLLLALALLFGARATVRARRPAPGPTTSA